MISNNELSKLREHHRHTERLELFKVMAIDNENARRHEVELAVLKNQELQLRLNILRCRRQGGGLNAPAPAPAPASQ